MLISLRTEDVATLRRGDTRQTRATDEAVGVVAAYRLTHVNPLRYLRGGMHSRENIVVGIILIAGQRVPLGDLIVLCPSTTAPTEAATDCMWWDGLEVHVTGGGVEMDGVDVDVDTFAEGACLLRCVPFTMSIDELDVVRHIGVYYCARYECTRVLLCRRGEKTAARMHYEACLQKAMLWADENALTLSEDC